MNWHEKSDEIPGSANVARGKFCHPAAATRQKLRTPININIWDEQKVSTMYHF
ncbi:hypothetical protein [Burkholderia sp. MSMB175]|uniref:hypothetical protein n=1 Tax=Burkholderia sp. MSMB175 TaxID=1086510 RepID=UPI0012EAA4E5|nr:hypothetical protein [Burkholderia sp. MSMB175]